MAHLAILYCERNPGWRELGMQQCAVEHEGSLLIVSDNVNSVKPPCHVNIYRGSERFLLWPAHSFDALHRAQPRKELEE